MPLGTYTWSDVWSDNQYLEYTFITCTHSFPHYHAKTVHDRYIVPLTRVITGLSSDT